MIFNEGLHECDTLSLATSVCQDRPKNEQCPASKVTHTYNCIVKQDKRSIIQRFNSNSVVNTAVQDNDGLNNNVGSKATNVTQSQKRLIANHEHYSTGTSLCQKASHSCQFRAN